jgi:hypothetical protein
MNERDSQIGASAAGSGVALVVAAEAALADLERRLPLGMGPLEQVEASRIRKACQRLLECAGQLETDELMVRGSTGQRRAHPLLKVEQDLRREISDNLAKLSFRAEQRAMYVGQKAAHAARRLLAGPATPETET